MRRKKLKTTRFRRICEFLAQFFAAVPGSVKGHVSTEELSRIVVASLSAGGGLFGVLQMAMVHLGALFPAPTDAALAAIVLSMILETRRRLAQGEERATRAKTPRTS